MPGILQRKIYETLMYKNKNENDSENSTFKRVFPDKISFCSIGFVSPNRPVFCPVLIFTVHTSLVEGTGQNNHPPKTKHWANTSAAEDSEDASGLMLPRE